MFGPASHFSFSVLAFLSMLIIGRSSVLEKEYFDYYYFVLLLLCTIMKLLLLFVIIWTLFLLAWFDVGSRYVVLRHNLACLTL